MVLNGNFVPTGTPATPVSIGTSVASQSFSTPVRIVTLSVPISVSTDGVTFVGVGPADSPVFDAGTLYFKGRYATTISAIPVQIAPSTGGGTAAQIAADALYRSRTALPRVKDSFAVADGTPLNGHAADTGQVWATTAGALTISGDFLGGSASGASRASLGGTLDAADQDASFVLRYDGTPNVYLGVFLRAGANNSGYYVGVGPATNGTQAMIFGYGRDGTDRGALAQSPAAALPAGDHTILATVRGSGALVTISVYVDGALACSYVDTDAKRLVDPGTLAILTVNPGGSRLGPIAVRTWGREPLRIGAFGNSIAAGFGVASGGDPLSQMGLVLSRTGGFDVTTVNRAISGTTIGGDWQPGSTNLVAAKAAWAAAGVTDAMLLGKTNEAKTANRQTPAAYRAALAATLADLTGSGYRVFLCSSPPVTPGVNEWDAYSNELIAAYEAVDCQIADGTRVLLGGRAAFATFGLDRSLYADGIHPTAAGAALLGQDWAAGYLKAGRASETPVLP